MGHGRNETGCDVPEEKLAMKGWRMLEDKMAMKEWRRREEVVRIAG